MSHEQPAPGDIRKLVLKFPQSITIFSTVDKSESYVSQPGAIFSVLPLSEQNLDSGLIAVQLVEEGKESAISYMPFVQQFKEQLGKSLTRFDKSALLSPPDDKGRRAESILSTTDRDDVVFYVEEATKSEVMGPDFVFSY